MLIKHFSMVFVGLMAYIFTSSLTAVAASFNKYIVAPLGNIGTTHPSSIFQVKASDSVEVEYLRFFHPASIGFYALPMIGISPSPDAGEESARTLVGGFDDTQNPLDDPSEVSWRPFPNEQEGETDALTVEIDLNVENGVDEHGHIKLLFKPIPYCNLLDDCFPINSVFTVYRDPAQRMTTLNGNQIEVVPVIIQRNGLPWTTHYFGYSAGLVAVESFSDQMLSPSFLPVTLPQPKVEGTVVEYVNTIDFPNEPGGHYFYTAAPGEQAKVDAGSAGHFVRTGLEFASGGFVPICRFYGSMSPGPNSHFFTGSEAECQWLQSLQATPIPTDVQQWNYEGIAFYSVVPVRDAEGQKQCMTGTAPVYRAYNNAYPKEGGKNPWDSNHRYSTDRSVMDGMVSQGWRDEGVVLCAPLN